MWRPLWAIIHRELVRMVRQRGRLVAAMVRPLVWLLIIGAGLETMLGDLGPGGYRSFIVPGLVCMVLLFGAMFAALSLVYDKESGVMRMLVIAPFAHYWIILARTTSATTVAVAQGLMFVVVLLLLGYAPAAVSPLLAVAAFVLTALACSALGLAIAVFCRTLDNFAVIINFVMFPVFFLSGALYPIAELPPVLKAIALVNPFSYGVDLMKHAMSTGLPEPFGPDFPVWLDIGVIAGFTVAALAVACIRFSQDAMFEGLARWLSGTRTG